MTFNTAILYDIENLMGGYSKAGYLSGLSLKDIYEEIMQKDIPGIAIQRAYANWGDTRLNILRNDIVELGIEPVQMFGFGRGPNKNASDIQLAIDAVDIAFTKQVIEQFVIVSGDGGFSSLAKKLHEYGKKVIGCAYSRTTNKVFEAVCDDFIWIPAPKEDDMSCSKQRRFFIDTNPTLTEFARNHKTLNQAELEKQDIFAASREIYDFLMTASTTRVAARKSGINIGVITQLLSYRIDGFDFRRYGFSRFVDYIRFTIQDTQAQLILNEPSDYRIASKHTVIPGFSTISILEKEPELHTLTSYRELLSRVAPRYPLPEMELTHKIASYLVENKHEFVEKTYAEIVEMLSNSDEGFEQKSVREAITCFISAGCLVNLDDNESEETYYSFACMSPEDAIAMLKQGMHDKLEEILGEAHDSKLDILLPDAIELVS